MIDNETGMVQTEERLPNLPRTIVPQIPTTDNFESETLSMQWNTIHPPVEPFYSLTERSGFLRLFTRPEVLEEICTPSFVGRRQQHKTFLARTAMEFIPQTESEEAGVAILQDDRFNYIMVVIEKDDELRLELHKTENGTRSLISSVPVKRNKRIYLSIQGNVTDYSFYYGYDEQEMILLASGLDASLLSSVVNEGFTGAYMGMYTSSNIPKALTMLTLTGFLIRVNNFNFASASKHTKNGPQKKLCEPFFYLNASAICCTRVFTSAFFTRYRSVPLTATLS